MRVKYTISTQTHEFDVSDTDDLAEICSEIESRLRSDHPDLAGQSFLTEKVADALLNTLAADGTSADLGDLSPQKFK